MALLNRTTIVNQAFTQGSIAFNEMYISLLKGLDPWSAWVYTQATMTGTVDFSFMKDVPRFQRLVGPVGFSDIEADNYTVDIDDFGCGIKIHKNEINDDLLNIIKPRIDSMVEAPPREIERLAFDALLAGIATTTYGACWDGQALFSATHPVGGGNQSNYVAAGGATEWYLIDASHSTSKPVVLAMREEPEYEQESLDGSHYFETGELRFKAEGRLEMGYGMWQRAYCQTNTMTEALLWTAIQTMREYTNDVGEFLGVRPTHLLVAPDTERVARNITQRYHVNDGTTTVSNEPVHALDLEIVVSPHLI